MPTVYSTRAHWLCMLAVSRRPALVKLGGVQSPTQTPDCVGGLAPLTPAWLQSQLCGQWPAAPLSLRPGQRGEGSASARGQERRPPWPVSRAFHRRCPRAPAVARPCPAPAQTAVHRLGSAGHTAEAAAVTLLPVSPFSATREEFPGPGRGQMHWHRAGCAPPTPGPSR